MAILKNEQIEVWAHGSRFIVRRVNGARHQYVIFASDGRYLVKINWRNVRRWVNHFGLKFLKA